MYITRRLARNIVALGVAFMTKWTRCAALLVAAAFVVAQSTIAPAQTVTVNGPPGPVLETITPRFTIIARGFPVTARPLFYTLFISRSPTGEGAIEQTVTRTASDTIVNLLVSRPLTSGVTVYWKARIFLEDGVTSYESPVSSARQVPEWVRLLKPGTSKNDPLYTRQPLFQWQSPKIDPEFGFFSYDLQVIEVKEGGGVRLSVANIRDSTYVPTERLDANQAYRTVLRATVQPTGESVLAPNIGNFTIFDPSLPTTNLLYQNFPNPFPSSNSLSTCFWFDVKVGGSTISLDVLDLRGSVVKRIVPLAPFNAGPYGRGLEGTGSSCDGKYVWNGTGTDGRIVPAGVYLARFTATGSPPQFKKIVFNGR